MNGVNPKCLVAALPPPRPCRCRTADRPGTAAVPALIAVVAVTAVVTAGGASGNNSPSPQALPGRQAPLHHRLAGPRPRHTWQSGQSAQHALPGTAPGTLLRNYLAHIARCSPYSTWLCTYIAWHLAILLPGTAQHLANIGTSCTPPSR